MSVIVDALATTFQAAILVFNFAQEFFETSVFAPLIVPILLGSIVIGVIKLLF